MNEKRMNKVRRSWLAYLNYGLLLLLSLCQLFLTHTIWTYGWMLIGFCSAIILVRIILKPYYFEVNGTHLLIHRDFFYKDLVLIDDIEKIELEESPFSKSYIRMKSPKIEVGFQYLIVNDTDFKRLQESLQLRVE